MTELVNDDILERLFLKVFETKFSETNQFQSKVVRNKVVHISSSKPISSKQVVRNKLFETSCSKQVVQNKVVRIKFLEPRSSKQSCSKQSLFETSCSNQVVRNKLFETSCWNQNLQIKVVRIKLFELSCSNQVVRTKLFESMSFAISSNWSLIMKNKLRSVLLQPKRGSHVRCKNNQRAKVFY
jgi:hypothetical protein